MRYILERCSMIFVVVAFWFAVVIAISSFQGCGEIDNLIDDINNKPVETPVPDKPIEVVPPVPTITPEVTPTNEPITTHLFIPDNCANPPKNITFNDGWKCIASSTRGGSIVCLLPYQFTWSPYVDLTDHHGVTMKCSKNDKHFDSVDLVYKNGNRQSMDWDKCQNWVGTTAGKIGRQHWRAESVNYDKVKDKLQYIEMTKGSRKTCLKF